MYQFVSALLRRRGASDGWKPVDISQTSMADLFTGYQDGVITLNNPFISGNVFVSLTALRLAPLPFYDLSFEDWLSALGNRTIPALVDEPQHVQHYVNYSDAWQSGYNIDSVSTAGFKNGPVSERVDLVVTRPYVRISDLQTRALFTVNGLLHYTTPHTDGVTIKSGGRSGYIARDNRVGIIDFTEVGTVTCYPFNPTLVQPINGAAVDGVYYQLPVDLSGKTVMLSLGGYLHVLDSTHRVLNPQNGVVGIYLSKLDLRRRIFESRYLIDTESLALTQSPTHLYSVNALELKTDEFVYSYLALPQSFLIVVDTPNIAVDRVPVIQDRSYGQYQTHTQPRYPLVFGSGIMPEYWCKNEDDLWVMSVSDNQYKQYLFETAINVPNITPALQVTAVNYELAHLLQIKAEYITGI